MGRSRARRTFVVLVGAGALALVASASPVSAAPAAEPSAASAPWSSVGDTRAPASAPPPFKARSDGYVRDLQAAARARGLADTRQWQVLLHYRRSWAGQWLSEADGPGFFLAGSRGRRDPDAELQATLAAFFAPALATGQSAADVRQHPQCAFPARFAWLKRELNIDSRRLPEVPCPVYDEWRRGIAPRAVTLAYATAFMNSPASIYGHTFLRLSRSTGEGNPLLDYVLNFAADVDTKNGLVYAVKGVSGGFRGLFYVMPYYVKVQEYSNMESRDLFEYELSLSQEQVERLVAHAWETRSTYFNYYFFSKNCSYQLLTLLEVADPDLHLVDQFGGRVIPADTLRAVLAERGLVRSVRPRPSLRSVMAQRKAVLTDEEVRIAEAWVAAGATGPTPSTGKLSKERQALIIDAAYDYSRYREGFHAEPSDDFKQRERRLLLARGRLGVPPQDVITSPAIAAPEGGHATLRLAAGAGTSNQAGMFETLSVRGAIHDYLDPPVGYPQDATLEMGQLRLRFDNRQRRLNLDRLDAINILSAAPLDRWTRGFSWKVWIGADNAREIGCERSASDRQGWRCLYAGATTGGGFAARTGAGGRALWFALAETDVGVGPAFADGHDFRVGAGGEIGLVGQVASRWRFQARSRYLYYFLGDHTPGLRAEVINAFSIGRAIEARLGSQVAGAPTTRHPIGGAEGMQAQITVEILGYF